MGGNREMCSNFSNTIVYKYQKYQIALLYYIYIVYNTKVQFGIYTFVATYKSILCVVNKRLDLHSGTMLN